MKKIIFLLLLIFACTIEAKFDFHYLKQIPILHEGRIKPLDTFARVNLLLISEKSKLKDMCAIEWLSELLFETENAYKRPVFRIRNPEVVKALDIKQNDSNLYSFNELSKSIRAILPLINELFAKDQKLRSPSQNQLINLYQKIMIYFEISRSMTLLRPVIELENKRYNFLQLQTRRESAPPQVETLLKAVEETSDTQILKIVPPQFDIKEESHWFSPWQLLLEGKGTPKTLEYFNAWTKVIFSYLDKDENNFKLNSKEAFDLSLQLSKTLVPSSRLKFEKIYNELDLFTVSISFYIISFLLLSFSWIYTKKILTISSLISLVFGSLFHLIGLGFRCFIMNRPPVSTLYESVVFVALVCTIAAICYEIIKRNNIGTFVGSILGTILIFISFGYEKEGDSLGMLAAVLNTNFWLATHVVTITIGYGCCFVASVLGHVYLVFASMKNQKVDLISLNKSMVGATLYSLLFTILGTILGGIWADQSWGRFWGWDPKENGAMLICLWLLFVLHGRLAGFFKPKYYAMVLVFTSVIVALAWFGVNLLNVGLHSYGFTDSIALNLLYFSLIEVLFIIIMFFKTKKFQREIQ